MLTIPWVSVATVCASSNRSVSAPPASCDDVASASSSAWSSTARMVQSRLSQRACGCTATRASPAFRAADSSAVEPPSFDITARGPVSGGWSARAASHEQAAASGTPASSHRSAPPATEKAGSARSSASTKTTERIRTSSPGASVTVCTQAWFSTRTSIGRGTPGDPGSTGRVTRTPPRIPEVAWPTRQAKTPKSGQQANAVRPRSGLDGPQRSHCRATTWRSPMDAVTVVPAPTNEPVHDYAPGSPERARLRAKLSELAGTPTEISQVIGGVHRTATGSVEEVVQPHRHASVIGSYHNATHGDVADAIEASVTAAPMWRDLPFDERAAVFLRAADLLAGPWREPLAAATMLGQSKTAYQAEIDCPCELVDFLRFNVHFARQILADQPVSSAGVWNRVEYRPLEGFVYAITPFNFSAIAGNLPTAPALMGNTVIWKPSPTQAVAAYLTMQLLEAAGLPAGVNNLVLGDGPLVSEVALADPRLAGIHFTGSTATFQRLWSQVGNNIDRYQGYPRLVGETGGKDFILAHASADPDVLATAMIRGAFDYQGQKCSAASRAFVPRSLWSRMGDDLLDQVRALRYGDVTDLTNFGGAVIDRRAFDKNAAAIERAKATTGVSVAAGGTVDDAEGFFVAPTVLLGDDPTDEMFSTEYFGPLLSVHVYEDSPTAFTDMMRVVDQGSSYALTGAVVATDRVAIAEAASGLRFAAGNFYVNDKPTGAVVGQQPFGGGRTSGTNDKAGSAQNLLRWTSTRSMKETFVPPRSPLYPHQAQES